MGKYSFSVSQDERREKRRPVAPKRKPIKKSAKPIKRGRNKIAYRTKKRAKQERKYIKLKVEIFNKEEPECMAKFEGCSFVATDIHHSAGKIGDLLTKKELFVYLCRNCHDICEAKPKLAKELELSISRLAKK